MKPPYFPSPQLTFYKSIPPTHLPMSQHGFFSSNPVNFLGIHNKKSQVLTDFYKNQMLPVAPSQVILKSQPAHTWGI